MNMRIVLWLLLAGLLAYSTLARADDTTNRLECNDGYDLTRPIDCVTGTPLLQSIDMNRQLMLSAAGEDPSGKIRTIKVDDDGRVILSPTGTQMDIEGRIKLNVSPDRTLYDRHGRDVKACLAKMEAALKAVGPLAFGPPTSPGQFMHALTLFDDARDCWTTP